MLNVLANLQGGRCLTESTTTVSGDGLFQAHVYIHTNVAAGTGVFTINAEPQPFDVNNELDLIVINVAQGIMKSGKPEHNAASFPISEYVRSAKHTLFATKSLTRLLNLRARAPFTLLCNFCNAACANLLQVPRKMDQHSHAQVRSKLHYNNFRHCHWADVGHDCDNGVHSCRIQCDCH